MNHLSEEDLESIRLLIDLKNGPDLVKIVTWDGIICETSRQSANHFGICTNCHLHAEEIINKLCIVCSK